MREAAAGLSVDSTERSSEPAGTPAVRRKMQRPYLLWLLRADYDLAVGYVLVV